MNPPQSNALSCHSSSSSSPPFPANLRLKSMPFQPIFASSQCPSSQFSPQVNAFPANFRLKSMPCFILLKSMPFPPNFHLKSMPFHLIFRLTQTHGLWDCSMFNEVGILGYILSVNTNKLSVRSILAYIFYYCCCDGSYIVPRLGSCCIT